MSRENVEIVRRACDAAWHRPKPDFDTLNAIVHPEHEMFTVQSLVEGGEGYIGARGFREWLLSWNEMFGEDWESSIEQAEAIDDERVLVTGWMNARSSGGGVPIEQRFWLIMRVRDGKVTQSKIYTDHGKALQAAGLSE